MGSARGPRTPAQLRRVRRDLARGGLRRREGARSARGVRQPFERRAAGRRGFEEFEFGDLDDMLGRSFNAGRGERRGNPRMRGPGPEAALELDFGRGARRRAWSRSRANGGSDRSTCASRPANTGGAADSRQGRSRSAAGRPAISPWCFSCGRTAFRREGRELTFDLPIAVMSAARRGRRGARARWPRDADDSARTDSGTRLRRAARRAGSRGGAAGGLPARVQIRWAAPARRCGAESWSTARARREDRGLRQGVANRRAPEHCNGAAVLLFLARRSTRGSSSACARRVCSSTPSSRPAEPTSCRSQKLLMEDLGVNAEGVDVPFHLRRQSVRARAARVLADALEPG